MKHTLYILILVLTLTACTSNNILDKKYLGVYSEMSIHTKNGRIDPCYAYYKIDFQKDSMILYKQTLFHSTPIRIETFYISTATYKRRLNTIKTSSKLIPKLKIKGDKLLAPEVYDKDQFLLVKNLVFEDILTHSDIFWE